MAMFTVYFDCSGDESSTPTLTVAGFIADADQWIKVQSEWQPILDRAKVSRLHMREFAHSVGEYVEWKGDEDRRRKFLSDLIDVIVPSVRHSFACSIDLLEYRRIDKLLGARSMRTALGMAGTRCILNVMRWARHEKVHPDSILYIFEDGDADKADLIRAVERDFGFTPLFQPKGKCSALQAADLIAYEHQIATRRMFASPDLIDMHELRKPLQRIYWTPHFVNGEDSWVAFEGPNIEAGFRKIIEYEKQKAALSRQF